MTDYLAHYHHLKWHAITFARSFQSTTTKGGRRRMPESIDLPYHLSATYREVTYHYAGSLDWFCFVLFVSLFFDVTERNLLVCPSREIVSHCTDDSLTQNDDIIPTEVWYCGHRNTSKFFFVITQHHTLRPPIRQKSGYGNPIKHFLF